MAAASQAQAQPASFSFDGEQFVRKLVRDQGQTRVVEYYPSGEADWIERLTFTWSPYERMRFVSKDGDVTISPRPITWLVPADKSEAIDLQCHRVSPASLNDGGLIVVEYERRFGPHGAYYADVMALRSRVADAMAWFDLGPMRTRLAPQQAEAARSGIGIEEMRHENENRHVIFPR
jgi:hypothetical protein